MSNCTEISMTTNKTIAAPIAQPSIRSLRVVFTLDAATAASLDDDQALRDETTSWLESLGATVHSVTVAKDNPG
jgi:hypothetical protein